MRTLHVRRGQYIYDTARKPHQKRSGKNHDQLGNSHGCREVLRSYLACQTASEKAQNKDFSEIDRLFRLLQNPYSDQFGMGAYAAPPPQLGQAFVGQLLVLSHPVRRASFMLQ